ncbi:MAG: hypothetical protein EB086_15065 [Rhodobacteraceae bacterium]|nr:hypothetical protein [Paracoccaceae bacterium]
MMRMDPPRGFGTPEFQKRTVTIQAAMAQEGLDGLLVMSEAEVRYFSGIMRTSPLAIGRIDGREMTSPYPPCSEPPTTYGTSSAPCARASVRNARNAS